LRLAVYAAPAAGTPLHAFASAWLGRDADTGADVPQPTVPGLAPERLRAITGSPRHYGFHATLKAPFVPAPGVGAAAVADAAGALARRLRPVQVPLALGSLGGFLALVPAGPLPALDRLAAACVTELDSLRAPLDGAELARRRAAGLDPVEDAHLARWGYPYVLDRFRYHMTLTERLAEPEHAAVRAALAPRVAPLCAAPWPLDALVVFAQADRAAPFTVVSRHPLQG
jgi:putative phosphonate metabolism protein